MPWRRRPGKAKEKVNGPVETHHRLIITTILNPIGGYEPFFSCRNFRYDSDALHKDFLVHNDRMTAIRTRKLTDPQVRRIRFLHDVWNWPNRVIAEAFGIAAITVIAIAKRRRKAHVSDAGPMAEIPVR